MNARLELDSVTASHSPVTCHTGARILYVEDEPVTRSMCSLVLGRAGFAVTTAVDGQEGWSAQTSEPFSLVITDNHMPHLTGLELVTRARTNGIAIPFIVASGSIEPFVAIENRWLRLAALIQKPFGPDDLVVTVREVLEAEFRKLHTRPFAPSSGCASERATHAQAAV